MERILYTGKNVCNSMKTAYFVASMNRRLIYNEFSVDLVT